MLAPDTIYSKICRMRGKKGTRTMHMGIKLIICKSNKHPKRNHYMVTKWSKKYRHEN